MSSKTTVQDLLQPGRRVTDWGRMRSANVKYIAVPAEEHDLQLIVRHAAAEKLKVTVRGIGHSAGGHSFADDALMIELRRLNRVLDFNPQQSLVRVQAGSDWATLTRLLEPAGLAVSTKQEFDTFSIGGSLAANVHGKSVDYGPLIDHVESFRLLQADGEIINVSRNENGELFSLVIGGYGLFGILVDVTLRLVKDRPVRKSGVVYMDQALLIRSYVERIRREPLPPICYGFLNSTCDIGYYVTYDYVESRNGFRLEELPRDEPSPTLFNLMVRLQRWSSWFRERSFKATWVASAKPETTLRSRRLLLWDKAPRAFDGMLLQKYFVPVERFTEFAQHAGAIFRESGSRLPLLMNHFRFVPGNNSSMMSFAVQDSMCMIPCYLANKGSSSWLQSLEKATNELLDVALGLGGSYYLTFDTLASPEQLHRAYPRAVEFFALKRKYDPGELFVSKFYERYAPSARRG